MIAKVAVLSDYVIQSNIKKCNDSGKFCDECNHIHVGIWEKWNKCWAFDSANSSSLISTVKFRYIS